MELTMQGWFSGPLGTALVRLLNMSAAAAVLVCAVVLLRALLRKAPKWTRCILWAIVAVQLVCPLSLRSPLSVYSLLPRSSEVTSDQVEVFRLGGGSEKPTLVLDTPQIAGYAPGAASVSPSAPSPVPTAQAQHAPDVFLPTAGAIWLAGVALMLLYALLSYLSLRRRVRFSVPLEGNVFLCDGIATPFILGVLRPRVYLPSGLNEAQKSAVLSHETAHLRRRDHWWKLLGWLLLAVHWFNPLVWLAYALFCRDVELACDEKVVRGMESASRADYSQALLDCAAPRAAVRACPLAFGEVGIRARIKAVLNYKKPAFWIVVLAVIVCIVMAVCFLTRPGPIETPPGAAPAVTPTPRPTAPAVLPTAELYPTGTPVEAIYDMIDPETADTYILDSEYYSTPVSPFMRFYIILDREKELFQYYESPISSYYIGLGRYRLEDGILTIEDNRVNRFRMEDGKLVWIAEGSDNFTFVKLTDGATFSLDTAPAAPVEDETPEPYLTVTGGGQSAAAATHILYQRLWADELRCWIAGDGLPVETLLEHPERIPTLTLTDDLTLRFGGGAVRKSQLVVYDEELVPIKENYYGDTALNWLEPGSYYCGVEVFVPQGRYIEEAEGYEESVYLCVFRLVVPSAGPAPYTPAQARDLTEARLRFGGDGKDYVVRDPEALAQLERWFSGATELVGGAGCPFGSLLTLTRADGSAISLCPAEDSCGTVFSDGRYYRFDADNEAFWALFGIRLF